MNDLIKKIVLVFFGLQFLISCSSMPDQKIESDIISDHQLMERAIDEASPSGKKVLETSREMIGKKDVVIGGCWDYINAVYKRAGISEKEREIIFKGKFKGPYVDPSLIEAGDWLYFVNHTYSDIEHSAIFIAWTNVDKKEALMVNYVGGNQKKPGTYKRFVLDQVYNIFRGMQP